jgi:hypothetical protein
MFVLGTSYFANGTLSPTALIPLFPFVFILCVSVFCLCLVLVLNIADSFKNAGAMLKSKPEKPEEKEGE